MMFTYTTCGGCGETLLVTAYEQTTHFACTRQITRAEYLAQEFLQAAMAHDDTEAARIEALIDEIDSAPPRLCEAAGLYASWGWAVFPLLPKGVRNRHTGEVSDGKKPATRHGFKNATTDADRIYAWWSKHPNHNIGLATGHQFDVIDIDVPDGVAIYHRLLAAEDPATGRGPLPDCHGRVVTASGGLHLYVEPTGKGNKAGRKPGLDYRGVGGYVVAPPSTLGSRGRAWSWSVKPSPTIVGNR